LCVFLEFVGNHSRAIVFTGTRQRLAEMRGVQEIASVELSRDLGYIERLLQVSTPIQSTGKDPVSEGVTRIEFHRRPARGQRLIVCAGFHTYQTHERCHRGGEGIEVSRPLYLSDRFFMPLQQE
jgi:hypothetical protein